MLPPSALQPGTSGLAWGATLDDCRRALDLGDRSSRPGTTQVERRAPDRFALAGHSCGGTIWIADDGLRFIRVYLHVTTDFWHHKFGEPGPSREAVLDTEVIPVYEAAVAAWAAILGPPTWSGINPRPRRPEQWGWYVTYWHVGDDQLQVEVHQEDVEFPFVVALASFARVPMTVPVDPLLADLAASDVQTYQAEWHGIALTEPVEAIRRFVGRPGLPFDEENGRWHLPYPKGNPHTDHFVWGYFQVDAAGRVRHAEMSPEIVPLFGRIPAQGAPIDRPTALRAAAAFLTGRVAGFGDLELHREETEDRGEWSDGVPYEHHQFTWQARHGPHRALGLGRVCASVDSAGSLVKFGQDPPVPVTVNLEPTLARDDALALAQARYGKPITAIEAELHVGEPDDDDGQQVLYWIVSLTGTEPFHPDGIQLKGASYAFDAHTGRIRWEFVSQDAPTPPGDTTGDATE